MIRLNEWSPDTCGCTLQYAWDDQQSEDKRVHVPVRTVVACPAHGGLDRDMHYSAVLHENQSKNLMRQAVFDKIPRLRAKRTLPDGSTAETITSGFEGADFMWAFDGLGTDRSLTVIVLRATAAEKAQLRPVAATMAVPTAVV